MVFVNILLYVLLPAVIAGYLFLRKKFAYFEERNIPHIAPESLITGNMGEVGTKVHIADFIRKVYSETKDKGVISGFFTMFRPSILINDLELVKEITVKDFHNFTDRGVYMNEKVEPITGNLLGLTGDKWKFVRNKLSPALTSGKIKTMYHTVAEKGKSLVEAIERGSRGGSIDIKNITSRFSVDVISSCAFGLDVNTLANQNPEMIAILRKVFGDEGVSQFKFVFLALFPDFAKLFQLRMFPVEVNDFFVNVMGGSMKQREENKVVRNDFLNMLIQLKNKGSIDGEVSTDTRKLTEMECIAQAFIFFLGGADTSASTIAYALLELGHLPEIQDKLRKEIIEKTQSDNGEITYDNLQEMKYLNQVINESLRKFPPAPVIVRQSLNDYKIPNSNFVIEKGTAVMVPIAGFHYDEKYWKNPEAFDPERFSPEESAKRPNLAFMPFGNGPRNCIGMRFGMISTAFAIATIIKNFKVTLDQTKTRLPLNMDPKSMTSVPTDGAWMKIEKLNQ